MYPLVRCYDMTADYDSKHLKFRLAGHYPKTEYWVVLSKSSSLDLGHIKWYNPWRRYVFFPDDGTFFDASCLSQISFFIKLRMEERKK